MTSSTYAIGHRGIPAFESENTVDSFRRALAYTNVLEVDVRVTRDGVPVCMHDATLERTHGAGARVGRLTYRELHAAAPEVPRLYDLLQDLGGQAGWFIDCKVRNPRGIESILATLAECGLDLDTGAELRSGRMLLPGTACLESPDAVLLQSIGSRLQAGRLELIRGHSSKRELMLTAPLIAAYAHGVVLPEALASRAIITLLRNLRLGVYVYTVDDPIRALQLRGRGVHGIFTDCAHELGAVLSRQ